MPQNHRGQEVGDNHFNKKMVWNTRQSSLHSGANWDQGYQVVDAGPEKTHHYMAAVTQAHGDQGPMDLHRAIVDKGLGGEGYGDAAGTDTRLMNKNFSTNKRAKIAAESMAKRDIEGRDLKTGKKKSS